MMGILMLSHLRDVCVIIYNAPSTIRQGVYFTTYYYVTKIIELFSRYFTINSINGNAASKLKAVVLSKRK